MNICSEIKNRVTAWEAAERYGILEKAREALLPSDVQAEKSA